MIYIQSLAKNIWVGTNVDIVHNFCIELFYRILYKRNIPCAGFSRRIKDGANYLRLALQETKNNEKNNIAVCGQHICYLHVQSGVPKFLR